MMRGLKAAHEKFLTLIFLFIIIQDPGEIQYLPREAYRAVSVVKQGPVSTQLTELALPILSERKSEIFEQ